MPKVTRNATVLFSSEQMFDLVNDVTQYPEFLPLCVASKVLEKSKEKLVAKLTLGKLGLVHSFTTKNSLNRPEKMTIELVEGPFKHLVGYWEFKKLQNDACKIIFELDFEVKGLLLSKTLSPVLEQVASMMVDSFCKRAQVIYKKKTSTHHFSKNSDR